MSSRCYEDFCLPDNLQPSSRSDEIGSSVGLFLLAAVVVSLVAAAAVGNLDLSSLDFSSLADNFFYFPY